MKKIFRFAPCTCFCTIFMKRVQESKGKSHKELDTPQLNN